MTTPPDPEALLVRAATDPTDDAAREAFTGALLEAQVVVLGEARAGGGFQPLVLGGPAGPVVAFFSSPEAAEVARGQSPEGVSLTAQVVTCRDFWSAALRNNAACVLNPWSPYVREFTTTEMSDLLAGVTPGTQQPAVAAPTQVEVGEPTTVPAGLLDALGAHARALGAVDTATLAWIRYPDGLQGYLLDISTDLPREQVVAGLELIAPLLGSATMDVSVTTPDVPGLATSVPAFYARTT